MKNVISIKNIVISISFIGLLLIMYWDIFIDLIDVWGSKEEYSHGYMIPFVSLYFAWLQKDLILAEKFKPSWSGVVLSLFAIAVYFVGIVGDVYFLLRFSFIFLLIGLALSVCGFKVTRLILIPILLLIFCFPLPPVFQAGLTAKLQLISSQIGVSLIRFCDISVYLEGNVIDLGDYKLQVVEACSGLRYLFPLMSLAFICAYMFHVAFWKRTVLFLTAIPVTVFMNSFRIGVIGLLVEDWGISMAEGFIHDFEGWIVFMACFIILFFEMWLLSWSDRKNRGWDDVFGLVVMSAPAPVSKKEISSNSLNSYAPLLVLLVLIAVTIFTIKPLGNNEDVIPERKSFYEFPLKLSNWSGDVIDMDQATVEFLGLSDYILMNYKHTDKQEWVNFYVAYYQTQKHGVVPHSPKQCIPGGGWLITDIGEYNFKGVELNRVVITKGKVKQLVYYWYRQRGQDIASEYALKWSTFVGSFLQSRTDGALVRLTTTVSSTEKIADADMRLQAFILLVNDELSVYVPD